MIEYSACKEVAAQLGSRARDLYTVAREPMPLGRRCRIHPPP